MLYADNELVCVDPPMFIECAIISTDPGFKRDTARRGTKPAAIETGATLQVPLYLSEGERTKIDKRDGSFAARA